MSASSRSQKQSRLTPRKPTPSHPDSSSKSLPSSRQVVPIPETQSIMFTEGDPVEYEAVRAVYGPKHITKAGEAMFKRVTVSPGQRCEKSNEKTGRMATPGSHWLLSSGSETEGKRESPYRKSQTEEDILNVIAETKPKAQMSASPGKSNSSSYVSSPDRHRTPIPELERIQSLESKLRDSTEKCKFMERQYRDLLTKQIQTEHTLLSERRHTRNSDLKLTTTNGEDTEKKGGEDTVEGMLRRVLEELRELKGRMKRIEEIVERVGGSL